MASAFVQALADAEVNAQQAAALAGHSSLSAPGRYLSNTGNARELPLAALPALGVPVLPANDLGAKGTFAPAPAETPAPGWGAAPATQLKKPDSVARPGGFEPPTCGFEVPESERIRAKKGCNGRGQGQPVPRRSGHGWTLGLGMGVPVQPWREGPLNT